MPDEIKINGAVLTGDDVESLKMAVAFFWDALGHYRSQLLMGPETARAHQLRMAKLSKQLNGA